MKWSLTVSTDKYTMKKDSELSIEKGHPKPSQENCRINLCPAQTSKLRLITRCELTGTSYSYAYDVPPQ